MHISDSDSLPRWTSHKENMFEYIYHIYIYHICIYILWQELSALNITQGSIYHLPLAPPPLPPPPLCFFLLHLGHVLSVGCLNNTVPPT